MLNERGFNVGKLKEEVVRKIKSALYYKKYRENLERNKKSLETKGVLEEPFERDLFVARPPKNFEVFLRGLEASLKSIMNYV
jgi:hypothetical protein